MATGNRVVPGAPVTAEHTTAGQPVMPDQASWAAWAAQNWAAQHSAARNVAAPGAAPASQTLPAQTLPAQAPHGRAPRRLWRGAGGRWLVWPLRAVLWAVLLVIGYRGVAAIVIGSPVFGGTPAVTSARGHGFPVAVAKAYALEFGQAYLNFNPATAQRRAAALAGFVPPGTSPQFGWNGAGTQTLQSEQVAGVQVRSAHRAVVLLLARVNQKLLEVGVPVYAGAGGLVVSGQPAFIAAPVQVVPPQQAAVPADPAAARSLAGVLPAFFRAYASGNALQLSKLAVHGVQLTGLGGIVTFGGIKRLGVPAAAGPARRITVTVLWLTGGAPGASPPANKSASQPAGSAVRPPGIDMTYAMTVVRHGPTWLVRWIGPAVNQQWPSS